MTEAPTFSVGGALGLANKLFEQATPRDIWVLGEVQGLRRSQAGHLYLSLRDEHTDARLPVAALGRDAIAILATLRRAGVELADGLRLRLAGRLGVYAPRGTLELRASAVDPDVTVGQSALAVRALRAVLLRERLLGRQALLPVPFVPRHVVVVGPTGQGTDDLIGILRNSPWAVEVVLRQAPSEGSDAPRLITDAVLTCESADLLVLARGGGPGVTTAYNAEAVCRAVCVASVPVVSAIGHASDCPLVDECAWRAVPTPTAAAELICGLFVEADEELVRSGRAVAARARAQIAATAARIEASGQACSTAEAQADYASRAHRSAVTMRTVAVIAVVVAIALLLAVVLGLH